jgi:hypothetical protein
VCRTYGAREFVEAIGTQPLRAGLLVCRAYGARGGEGVTSEEQETDEEPGQNLQALQAPAHVCRTYGACAGKKRGEARGDSEESNEGARTHEKGEDGNGACTGRSYSGRVVRDLAAMIADRVRNINIIRRIRQMI